MRDHHTIARLEEAAKKRFNQNLREFLRAKLEEGLYDYEIGALLGVCPVMVGKIREHFGLKRTPTQIRAQFLRRLERKYGPEIVSKFHQTLKDPKISLQDLADHFGFSREYARQLFKKIHGFPYSRLRRAPRGRPRNKPLREEPVSPSRQSAI